jgi:predicted RNA binding protein YcfA (HicA-like mRNA interferase family)
MGKLPRLKAREAENILFKNGFILHRQKGSHKCIKGQVYP